ncbi:MAG: nicotinamide-nucleotide adenylyltransferase [Candidatus Brockarchaeota archaeon]|nr:nicotinamide-nucleotide adenylyltransferase [Candidatus Brockarchaeota archaeon]
MRSKQYPLYVARFQPVHNGHIHAIRHVVSIHDGIIIAVGSSLTSHDKDNPFTFGERLQMLHLALAEAGIGLEKTVITGVPDIPYAHFLWVRLVEAMCPPFKLVYTNQPFTARLFKEAGYEVKPIPFLERERYSGAEIRRRIILGVDWSQLVPASVYEYLVSIGGAERIRSLASSDEAV